MVGREWGGSKMQPGMTPLDSACPSSAVIPCHTADSLPDARTELVLTELRTRLGDRSFALWFEDKTRIEFEGSHLRLIVGSPFLVSCIHKQFRRELQSIAQQLLGPAGEFALQVDATLALQAGLPTHARPSTVLATSQSRSNATTRTTPVAPNRATASPTIGSPSAGGWATARQRRLADLADFQSNPTTEFALTACRSIANQPGTQFNPLVIYGPVGTGKTHLLEGVCRQLRKTQPQLQVALLTAEAFSNYFTQALTERTLPSFRHKFRGVDVLLIDDVEFFESKRVFQEEFLHTLCDLVDHGRQVIVTTSRHPRLLTKLNEELVSRFQAGLICRLETPDSETRLKILTRKAARHEAEIAPEALRYVAEKFTGNVRELEGALNCLQTYFAMTQQKVTATIARQILTDLERDCLRVLRLADIERVICQVFGVKAKDLKSDSRVRTVAQPRMLAMFLARKHTQAAYSEIGQHFGGRNHSTVMSAERKVQQWLEANDVIRVASQTWSFQEIVANLEQQLLAG